MKFGCCNCGDDLNLDKDHYLVCKACGGFCCNEGCRDDHECDEDGDL